MGFGKRAVWGRISSWSFRHVRHVGCSGMWFDNMYRTALYKSFVVMGHGVASKNQIDFLNGKIGSGITGQIQGRRHFGSCSNLDYSVHFTVHQCINPVSGARCKCVR